MAFHRNRSKPEVRLDSTPTGDEEYRDWEVPEKLIPTWDPDKARTRIDKISRGLAMLWSVFLIYVILAQGNKDGVWLPLPYTDAELRVVPSFNLAASEFVAVVTTTTAAVFGFLVIVANHLFKRSE